MAILHKFRKPLPKESHPTGGRKSSSLVIDDSRPLSGVFISERGLSSPPQAAPSSSSSVSSESATSEDNSSPDNTRSVVSWRSSGSKQHHKGSPAFVSNPDDVFDETFDRARQLTLVLQRARHLPGTWYYSSNHVLVNQERMERVIAPLIRMTALDEIARVHAEQMAAEEECRHLSLDALRLALKDVPCRRLGENSQKGSSIRDVHGKMMQTLSNKNNILDRRFTHMGMGTHVGKDGEIYLCQVFRG